MFRTTKCKSPYQEMCIFCDTDKNTAICLQCMYVYIQWRGGKSCWTIMQSSFNTAVGPSGHAILTSLWILVAFSFSVQSYKDQNSVCEWHVSAGECADRLRSLYCYYTRNVHIRKRDNLCHQLLLVPSSQAYPNIKILHQPVQVTRLLKMQIIYNHMWYHIHIHI